MKFTPEQEDIFAFVRQGRGHGIIDAVAGAGKTTTIMECARYAPDAGRVLFCAFNTSISREIKRKFVDRGMPGVTVKTIHSLGLQILRQGTASGRGYAPDERRYPTLYRSQEMQESLRSDLEDLVRLNKLDPRGGGDRQKWAVKNLLYRVEQCVLNINQKHRSVLPGASFEAFKKMVTHYGIFSPQDAQSKSFPRELRLYYRIHRSLLDAGTEMAARNQIIDFTDMIYLPFVWKLKSSIKYDYIFIDECQDLSKAQFAVATKFGQKGSRILAVGDPRQSIYGFTGADAESFSRVKRMTKAKQLPLTVCFRCPRKVIALAREIRSDITGSKPEEGRVVNITMDDVAQHARPNDLIISRFRAPLLLMVFDFIDAGKKVRIAPDEVNEFINELKMLFKPEERQANIKKRYREFSVLKQTVFTRNMWAIKREAGKMRKAEDQDLFLKQQEDYLNKRLEFLHKKQLAWSEHATSVEQLLKHLKAYVSAKEDAIHLSTIHRAKGLEEDRVFILDYDQLPFKRQRAQDWELVQEENLKYVAITRAKETLFLVESADLTELKEDGDLFDELPFE